MKESVEQLKAEHPALSTAEIFEVMEVRDEYGSWSGDFAGLLDSMAPKPLA